MGFVVVLTRYQKGSCVHFDLMMQNDTLSPSPQFNRSLARIKHLTDLGMRSFYFDSFGCRGRLACLLRLAYKSLGGNGFDPREMSDRFRFKSSRFAPLNGARAAAPGKNDVSLVRRRYQQTLAKTFADKLPLMVKEGHGQHFCSIFWLFFQSEGWRICPDFRIFWK